MEFACDSDVELGSHGGIRGVEALGSWRRVVGVRSSVGMGLVEEAQGTARDWDRKSNGSRPSSDDSGAATSVRGGMVSARLISSNPDASMAVDKKRCVEISRRSRDKKSDYGQLGDGGMTAELQR